MTDQAQRAGAPETQPVAWLSVDPVRRKVDFYPKPIAFRVEKAYNERDPWAPSTCVLGSDFFNATVHFHPSGSCYQTTPGMAMGRAGFKQPGYRSVKRVVLPAGSTRVQVHGKQVHGEWRIAASADDATMTFDADCPADCVVDGTIDSATASQSFRPWQGVDLSSGAWDVSVVVWQWCRGVPERHGNLMALGDEWWCPYLPDANASIEEAFTRNDDAAAVELLDRSLSVKFSPGSSFALQRDEARGKERAVRRVVKTVQEVKVMLDRMAQPPLEPSEIVARLPPGTVPHHFLCPITQDVMADPVKTVDGMTYDRPAIERWLQIAQTSPLTGLPLPSLELTPHGALRAQIEEFVDQHLAAATASQVPEGLPP